MGHVRGRPYVGLLAVLATAVLTITASALYIAAGGQLFGFGNQAFGMTPTDGLTRTLAETRDAARDSRHGVTRAAGDAARIAAVRPDPTAGANPQPDPSRIRGPREIARERARVLAWEERYEEAANVLAAVDDADHPSDRVDRARYLWWAGRPREADSLLSVVLERSPDLAEARGLQLLIRPSVAPAVDVASRWLRERPGDRFAHLWMARAHARNAQYALAEDQYRQVLALEEDADVRLELARMLITAGRYRSAVSELRRILSERPDPEVSRELAIALERDGQPERAAAVLVDLVAASGETPDLEWLARVLADAERYGEAAEVLERLEHRLGLGAALRIRRARYLWWSGQLRSADAVLTQLLAESGYHAEAYALREEIRRGIDPSVELARSWVGQDDTPVNRLRLARALVSAGRPGQSLENYAHALDAGKRDLLEEAVGAAQSADSLDAAIRFLDSYIGTSEAEDADLLLKLAQLESWSGRPDRAEIAYRRFLSLDPDHIEARFSLAQQLAWQDSSRWSEAEAALERVLDADDGHVGALLLLGDIKRWRGEAGAALALYERVLALDPDATGLEEGLRVARELLHRGEVPAGITRGAWTAAADSYRDSEGFDFVLSRLTRDYTTGFGTVSVGLIQGYSSGPSLPGWDRRAFAAGVGVLTRIPLGAGYAAVGEAGAIAFEGTPVTPTWSVGVEYRAADSRGVLRYDRSPGLREAGRFAALEAESVLDRISLSGSGSIEGWTVAGQGQWQRFGSTAGAGARYAAMLRSDRSIGESPLTLGAMIRAITAVDPAPATARGGLYWSPRSYIAPAITFGYGRPVGSSWWIGLRAAPGYAWIDERETGLVRYRDGSTPTLEAGGTIGYRGGRWTVDLSADGGGALRSGYASSSVSVQVSRTGGF